MLLMAVIINFSNTTLGSVFFSGLCMYFIYKSQYIKPEISIEDLFKIYKNSELLEKDGFYQGLTLKAGDVITEKTTGFIVFSYNESDKKKFGIAKIKYTTRTVGAVLMVNEIDKNYGPILIEYVINEKFPKYTIREKIRSGGVQDEGTMPEELNDEIQGDE